LWANHIEKSNSKRNALYNKLNNKESELGILRDEMFTLDWPDVTIFYIFLYNAAIWSSESKSPSAELH
jgi:hypothetical protein